MGLARDDRSLDSEHRQKIIQVADHDHVINTFVTQWQLGFMTFEVMLCELVLHQLHELSHRRRYMKDILEKGLPPTVIQLSDEQLLRFKNDIPEPTIDTDKEASK